MVTLFEAFDNRYRYDIITVFVDSRDFSGKLQEFCLENGFMWNDSSKEYFDVPLPVFCINLCLTEDIMMLDWRRDGHGNDDYWSALHYSMDPVLYRDEDFDQVKAIISGHDKTVPSYRPRRIDRMLEGFVNKYDKEFINILVETPEESEKIQRLLFSYDIPWGSGHKTPMYLGWTNFPDYLTVSLSNFFGSPELLHGSKPDEYQWSNINMDWTIYTIKDYDTIENILKYGKKVVLPSYRPRTIDRTLESFSPKDYPYGTVAFRVESKPEMEKVVTWFHDNWGIEKENDLDTIIEELHAILSRKQYTGDRCLHVSFVTKDFFVMTPRFITDTERKYQTDPTVYTVGDLGKFDMKPSYVPRRIDRTVEGKQWYPYRFKTEEEMVRSFGEYWRDTAFEDVGWNDSMDYLLDTEFPYHKYELNLSTRDGETAIERLPLGDTEHRFVDDRGKDWLVCWDMLTPNKPNVPSYEPRTRRLTESKRFGYELMIFDLNNNEELKNVITLFYEKYKVDMERNYSLRDFISIYTSKMNNNYETKYLIVDLLYNSFHVVSKDVLSGESSDNFWKKDLTNHDITDPNIYKREHLRIIDKMLTDRQWDTLKNLVRPSYEPRKIKREEI